MPGSFTVTTTGTPTATAITVSGALPDGVTFNNNTDGTATLAGTPAAGHGGHLSADLQRDQPQRHRTQDFTLTVENVTATPAFTSATSTTFRIGAAGASPSRPRPNRR